MQPSAFFLVKRDRLSNRFLRRPSLSALLRNLFWVGVLGFISTYAQAQEIEARAYSNAPIGMSFITGGIAQAKSGSYTLTTEAVSVTHVIDVAGQSGKITLVLPYAELSGTGNISVTLCGADETVVSIELVPGYCPAWSAARFLKTLTAMIT